MASQWDAYPPAPDASLPAPAAPDTAPGEDWSMYPAAVQHPVSGPSGDWWKDTQRFVGTAAANALQGFTSPFTGRGGISIGPIGDTSGATIDGHPSPLHFAPPTTPDQRAAIQAQQRDAMFNQFGATEYQPQTMGGRAGMSALSAALSGTPAQAIPSAAGGAAAQVAAEMVPDHPEVASTLAFILGGAGAAKTMNGVGRLTGIVPAAGGSLPAEDAALAQTAQQHGIPLSLAQVSRDKGIKYADSLVKAVPFSGADGFGEAQQAAFNGAVARTFGETADRITPEVIQNARARIGADFDGVASRSTIQADQPLLNDLTALESRVNDSAMAPEQKAAIHRQISNVLDTAANGNGTIDGAQYQTLTKRGSPLDSLQRGSNPDVGNFAGDLRDALDSALQRHAAPEDVATLQQARAQWKALKTVEPLTLRADTPGGATPSTGDISPAALRGAVNKSYGNAASASLGDVPLNDLAKIGQRFLKEPGSSGTGERNLLMKAGGTAMTAMEAIREGVPPHVAMGAPAAAWVTARALGAALRNQTFARSSIAASQNPNGFQFPATPNPLALQLMMQPSGNPPGLLPAAQNKAATPQ